MRGFFLAIFLRASFATRLRVKSQALSTFFMCSCVVTSRKRVSLLTDSHTRASLSRVGPLNFMPDVLRILASTRADVTSSSACVQLLLIASSTLTVSSTPCSSVHATRCCAIEEPLEDAMGWCTGTVESDTSSVCEMLTHSHHHSPSCARQLLRARPFPTGNTWP